ncbi:unnamed protein product [Blepharisma stoltei]|uniref:Uncharacterized protein n=1 Tax=Blepharisma stoltei TaxID=1481888 RepID=A0AAU9IUZ6_9CILI|nr:unnamed protein product [Blepharisma stoltei]
MDELTTKWDSFKKTSWISIRSAKKWHVKIWLTTVKKVDKQMRQFLNGFIIKLIFFILIPVRLGLIKYYLLTLFSFLKNLALKQIRLI